MAIYPLHTSTIITKDVLINSPFKAGMALVIDSNGRAIKADSQQLVFNTSFQKYGKFLGFSASDHDLSGNTIILPDNKGSNYLDINNRFIKNENTEYVVPKRGLLDLQDTAVSNFYNSSDISTISRRGIGVFNTPGDYFVTDQFNPVLHGDYGVDGLDIQTINPGDLLTFGGGINAGKLVKVNVNSFGPDILVVGQVSRYNSSTGLLYFRQNSYNLSFGTNNLTLLYDFGNPTSYTSGTTVNDLSSNGKNGTLQNGPVYTNFGSASYLTFDGSDDVIETSTNATGFGIYNNEYTLIAILNMPSVSRDQFVFGNIGSGGQSGLHVGFINGGFPTLRHFGADQTFFGLAMSINQNYFCVWRFAVATSTFFQNGNFYNFGSQAAYLGTTNIGISRNATSSSGAFLGRIYTVKIFNRALSNTEITNMYNLEKSRYGL